ncbi:MAG TPA: winged helix DNA-binding domain-containing protein [Dehalococcoidia bacterium]|nr:winged helix DNA-binding domain-containing protein [Dehalococcoidia bacterium]
MDAATVARLRLHNQQIARHECPEPGQIVSWLGAMQAQDYAGALWSIGLRLPAATIAQVEQAVGDRQVVRTWALRGTLHFVAAADMRWLLALLAPRNIARSARRQRQLELDEAVFALSRAAVEAALAGGGPLTRATLLQSLERAGVSTAGQRGYHILWRLANDGVICFGPSAGTQQTFVLLDEWLPATTAFDREQAIGELARRYFTSHGPATLRDFTWWSGLSAGEARAGLDLVKPGLTGDDVDGQACWFADSAPIAGTTEPSTYLLPGFDEYLLGYADRGAVLAPAHAPRIVPGGNGIFFPTVVIDGRVAGTWKRTLTRHAASLTYDLFAAGPASQAQAIAAAADRYGRFLGVGVSGVSAA